MGNKETGKTTFIYKLQKKDYLPEQTNEMKVEKAKIKLSSSKQCSILSKERYRSYKLVITDVPGKFSHRRVWRTAIKKNRSKDTTAIVLFIDPTQNPQDTKSATEDVFNHYMEALNTKSPEKADQKAKEQQLLLIIVVNKTELLDTDEQAETFVREDLKETLKTFREHIPKIAIEIYPVSVKYWKYSTYINPIFERLKRFFYDDRM
ncbi:MAG: Rab family GTPase [Candidatus Odinarchaeota archaeon]